MFDFSNKTLGLVHVAARLNARRLTDIVAPGAITLPTQNVNYHAAANLTGDLANNLFGCCVEAGMFRMAQIRMANAWKSTWTPQADAVLKLYSALTGFSQSVPASDNGTDVPTAMSWWAQHGLDLGLQSPDVLWPHVTVDHQNMAELQCAIDWFGGVGFSFALPKSAMNAATWDVPASGVDSPDGQPGGWGMHFAPSGRFDIDGNFYVVTWGEEVPVTTAFIQAYAVAADTGVSQTWLSASGKSPPGLTLAQLGTAAVNLAKLA